MAISRGLRNNNPGNIRHGATTWQGQSRQQTDPDFVQFTDSTWGIRAINKILDSYAKRGLFSVRQIISVWAPPSENDTEAYIRSVAAHAGVDPDAKTVDRAKLVAAIINHENGSQPYPIAQIQSATAMA